MNQISDGSCSHQMGAVRNKSKSDTQLDVQEIKIQSDVYQQREQRSSYEGDERSLVNWKADIFSDGHHLRQHDAV